MKLTIPTFFFGLMSLSAATTYSENKKLTLDLEGVTLIDVFKQIESQFDTGSQQLQKKEISGTVTDSKGLALPGVSVVVKGTITGSITNVVGQFRLSVPADDQTIVFSFIGMKTQEFPIAEETTFNVMILEDIVGLEEVVVVGYGTQKKASVVGAITNTTSNK